MVTDNFRRIKEHSKGAYLFISKINNYDCVKSGHESIAMYLTNMLLTSECNMKQINQCSEGRGNAIFIRKGKEYE